MHNWRLLLLAFLAVLQPIVSFTERNLFDGREKCCDGDSLFRDSRLSYGFNYNKLPQDRRLSRTAGREDQHHEIRIERARVIQSDIQRGNIGDNRRERVAGLRDDRQWRIRDTQREFTRNTDRYQRVRDVSRMRYSRESDIRQHDRNTHESSSSGSSRISRDMPSERRFSISMEPRREARPTSDVSKERRVQERRETREILQRAGNDVALREIASTKHDRRVVRERIEERRAQAEFRLQQNRESRSLDRRMNDRRTTTVSRVREWEGESRPNIRDTSDERRQLTERLIDHSNGRTIRYGTTSARRESLDRTVDARREARHYRDRSFDAQDATRHRILETRRAEMPQDRTLEERRGNLGSRARILEARKETRVFRERTLEARREARDRTLLIRESRHRTLDARKEVRRTLKARDRTPITQELRDRTLNARKEIHDTRDRSLEARGEARDRTLQPREIRDRTLNARKEIRDTRDRSLEARGEARDRTLQPREIRDRTLNARKEIRDTRDRALEAQREARDQTLITQESLDRTVDARKEVRDTRDRTFEARRQARDRILLTLMSRGRTSEARNEVRDNRDRTLEARDRTLITRESRDRILEARKEVRDTRGRTLEARKVREVRDRTSDARRESRDGVRDRTLEARKENRETSDRTLEARREVRAVWNRETRDKVMGVRREVRLSRDNQIGRTNSRDSRSMTDRELRSVVMERRNHPELRDARNIRMIRSFDARERDVSLTRADTRVAENTERDSRYRSSTDSFRSRKIFAVKPQPDEVIAMNWQHVFYTLQGIYLCGILIQMLSQKESNKKPRTLAWLTSRRSLIKAD